MRPGGYCRERDLTRGGINRDSDHFLDRGRTYELLLKHVENSPSSRSRISPSYYSAWQLPPESL